jgi:hypothetical protein
VESGEWRVESGEWRVESGEWRVESGEYQEQAKGVVYLRKGTVVIGAHTLYNANHPARIDDQAHSMLSPLIPPRKPLEPSGNSTW